MAGASASRGVAASLVLGLLAAPYVRAGEKEVDAQGLGILEAVASTCGKFDADVARKLQDRIAELVKGKSGDSVARARASDEYLEAYASVKEMAGPSDENAKRVCSESESASP